MKTFAVWIFIGLFVSCAAPRTSHNRNLVGVMGERAMVVSAHPLASKVGSKIIEEGGNAWDAAIAVQFALAVVYPVAGNLGGGGFAVFRSVDGDIGALDFREKAPKKAGRDMYLDLDGNIIDRSSLEGHLAVGVPGSVDGMVELHKKYGSKPWSDLVQPAIDLAEQGFQLTIGGAESLNRAMEVFVKVNTHPIHLARHAAWKPGDLLKQTDLARTLERIRDGGRKGFYEGETALLLIKEMKRGRGIITTDDLRDYHAVWRAPLVGSYRGNRIISMSPPSSGGVALLQLLQSIEKFPVTKFGHNHWKTVHIMTELEKRVYADRASYLGDPDFYEVPTTMLLDDTYLTDRMASISLKRSTRSSELKEGQLEIVESIETTHFSIVDPKGNAVAITTTLNSNFGSKVMVEGAGFFLNNEMDDFSIKSGVPNQFGLTGSIANEIVPGKRMLSSMTPTIVDNSDGLLMVLGTPGGSTIITSVFQTILNVIDHKMTMQQAVNAKRFHHQWLPDRILMEDSIFSTKTRRKLSQLGHEFESSGAIGRVDAILVLPDKRLEGAGDNRGEDRAVGF